MGETPRQRHRSSSNPMAQYFVQLREFERRLLREAFEAMGGDLTMTAEALGVHKHYVRARARLLGGVFNGEPKHEPPGLAGKAWNATAPSGRTRRKKLADTTEAPSATAALNKDAYVLDGPDGPVCSCGQPSTHEGGWCGICDG